MYMYMQIYIYIYIYACMYCQQITQDLACIWQSLKYIFIPGYNVIFWYIWYILIYLLVHFIRYSDMTSIKCLLHQPLQFILSSSRAWILMVYSIHYFKHLEVYYFWNWFKSFLGRFLLILGSIQSHLTNALNSLTSNLWHISDYQKEQTSISKQQKCLVAAK